MPKTKQDLLKKANNSLFKPNDLKKQNDAKNIKNLNSINSRLIVESLQADLNTALDELKVFVNKVSSCLFQPNCKNKKRIKS